MGNGATQKYPKTGSCCILASFRSMSSSIRRLLERSLNYLPTLFVDPAPSDSSRTLSGDSCRRPAHFKPLQAGWEPMLTTTPKHRDSASALNGLGGTRIAITISANRLAIRPLAKTGLGARETLLMKTQGERDLFLLGDVLLINLR